MISNYALLTNNVYFNEMLDDIRDDLNLYTGMSKVDLEAAIQ